jgi:hypothetical protein
MNSRALLNSRATAPTTTDKLKHIAQKKGDCYATLSFLEIINLRSEIT